MKILTIATSGSTGSIAIFDGPSLLGERTWSKDFKTNISHSELFSPALDDLLHTLGLELSKINYIAVDVGPGSFTGIRVGINAARTLAYSLGIPVILIDALTILAQAARERRGNSQQVLVAINAFRNFVYAAKFDNTNEELKVCLEPKAFVPEEFSSLIENGVLLIGDAKNAFLTSVSDKDIKKISFHDLPPGFSSAKTLGPLALRAIQENKTVSWKKVLPLYIRKSEAEEKLGGNYGSGQRK